MRRMSSASQTRNIAESATMTLHDELMRCRPGRRTCERVPHHRRRAYDRQHQQQLQHAHRPIERSVERADVLADDRHKQHPADRDREEQPCGEPRNAVQAPRSRAPRSAPIADSRAGRARRPARTARSRQHHQPWPRCRPGRSNRRSCRQARAELDDRRKGGGGEKQRRGRPATRAPSRSVPPTSRHSHGPTSRQRLATPAGSSSADDRDRVVVVEGHLGAADHVERAQPVRLRSAAADVIARHRRAVACAVAAVGTFCSALAGSSGR